MQNLACWAADKFLKRPALVIVSWRGSWTKENPRTILVLEIKESEDFQVEAHKT